MLKEASEELNNLLTSPLRKQCSIKKVKKKTKIEPDRQTKRNVTCLCSIL